jgi:hypothetical protein
MLYSAGGGLGRKAIYTNHAPQMIGDSTASRIISVRRW